jgi:uncharacterized protein with HEPN domain
MFNREGHRIRHMLEAIERINQFMDNKAAVEFYADLMLQSAVIRQLEIIGEASAHLSESFKSEYPDIPWRKLKGMRNVLIHEYQKVSELTVWMTVREQLPKLQVQLSQVLEGLQ